MTERERMEWIRAQEMLRQDCADAAEAAARSVIAQHTTYASLIRAAVLNVPLQHPQA